VIADFYHENNFLLEQPRKLVFIVCGTVRTFTLQQSD